MDAEAQPREELLGLVRSLTERLRVDGELGKPISYLSSGRLDIAATDAPEPTPAASIGGNPSGLEAVRTELGDCRRCPLGDLRHRLVFGEGNPHAELVFVGEAPGADEDAQGRPFVGRAGQLLTKIIVAMGLKREEVYICNIIKCRPPGNRNPQPEEISACEPFLIRQLEAIRPRVICALGSFAAHTLLKSEAPITVLRGRFHSYQGIPLMPTYHPAYLLRNPGAKKQVWEDVRTIMKVLREGT
ncbi:MAG: uracil-DNA glycosylase [Deltaproteobacteria bacterium]|nr:uracil-DNA glycosylase [Deltaproteobacteria bacterium]